MRNCLARRFRRTFRLEALEDRTLLSSLPIATPDFADTDGRAPVTVSVLANDNTLGGHGNIVIRSLTLASTPAHGNAVVTSSNGTITYRAFAGFSGADSFTYTFQDRAGNTSTPATVTVQVNRPHANDDFADTDGTHPVSVNVLQNDSDPDGHSALLGSGIAIASGPHNGTVSVQNGLVTYRGFSAFDGTDSFTYTVRDIHGATSNPATVVIQVHHPLANDDFATTAAGSPTIIPVLQNDSDPDGNQHLVQSSVQVVVVPHHGHATVNHSSGTITYTPSPGFSGTDIFSYNLLDNNGAASTVAGKVTVVVTPPPSPSRPTAAGDVADTDGTNPVPIFVLGNDSSPNGVNPRTVTILSQPGHGSVSVDPNSGTITYTAFAGFGRTDSFTYLFKDNTGAVSNPATVSVSVHMPRASDDYADTDGTTPVAVNVLANDTDPDGPGHLVAGSIHIVSGTSHGNLAVDTNSGQITYTAVAGFGSTDSFQYTVTDDNGAVSNPATVTLQVHLPTAVDDRMTVDGSHATAINVLANDSDPDGNQHLVPGSVTLTTGAQHGTASVGSNGQITYTAAVDFSGTDTFQYTVGDDNGAVSSPATVTVNVVRPTAFDFTTSTRVGVPVVLYPGRMAFDPLGAANFNPASVQLLDPPVNGKATIDPKTSHIIYTPDPGFTGTETLWYSIGTKGGTASDWGQVTIHVGTTAKPAIAHPSSGPSVFAAEDVATLAELLGGRRL